MKHLKALNKYFWKYRLRLSIGIVFIIVSNYFGVLAPQVIGFIIDFVQRTLPGYEPRAIRRSYDISVQKFIGFIENSSFSGMQVVIISGLIILGLALLRGFFMFLMRQTIIVMSRHIEFDQKNEVFQHYQQMDAGFYKLHSTGDLMSRMAEDVSRVRQFTGPAVMYLVNLVTLISLSVFFMFKREPELTLYVLAPLPVLAATIYIVNSIIHRKSESLQAALAKLTTKAQQSYSGIRVIKSFAQEKAMYQNFEAAGEDYRRQAIGLARVEALYFPSMTLLIGLSTLLTIMIGGIYYINGGRDIGLDTIVEFVIYINMLTFPVSAIGWTASMIQRAAASQKRLNEFLHTEPVIVNRQGARDVPLTCAFELQNISFTYPNTGITAIKNLSLKVNAGERVAVVGRTGSGKTTLAQLLMRMYDAGSGHVRFDGVEVQELELASLRRQISYVPQDGFLFSDSVENNIAFGTLKKDMEKIREAARLAVVDQEIENFPQQYKTEIGERGVSLSGGQKQRISIARALLKTAPLLILDDCLSAVDSRTEKEILKNLQVRTSGCTTLLITHRIFHLLEFDNIIVMEEGEIKEMGRHHELIKHRGIYYELYQQQLKEDIQKGN